MTTIEEFYLPPVVPVWPTCRDLLTALGCTLVRTKAEKPVGDAPTTIQLLDGGAVYCPSYWRLHSQLWAYIVHEAVHHHVGAWSIEDEEAMLPFELGLIRRIGKPSHRRACLAFMGLTGLPAHVELVELVESEGPAWVRSKTWLDLEWGARTRGLSLDGELGA